MAEAFGRDQLAGTRRDQGGSTDPTSVAEEAPVFVISVAAELAGMHPQTLRQYDRLGLVSPRRTAGGGRRYSARDVLLLRQVQHLSQEDGVNLAGVKHIIHMQNQLTALRNRVNELLEELAHTQQQAVATEAAVQATYRRDLSARRNAIAVWRPIRR